MPKMDKKLRGVPALKVTRHDSAPCGAFASPSVRFEHVHLDLIIMSDSKGYRCLTCIDRFSRWPEVIPLMDQEAATFARAFYEGWIARFGTPLRITTDQGRQFESQLFKQLSALYGVAHLRTTTYHPAANGMIERLHRQLKVAIKCRESDQWTKVLPTVLLGSRAAEKIWERPQLTFSMANQSGCPENSWLQEHPWKTMQPSTSRT